MPLPVTPTLASAPGRRFAATLLNAVACLHPALAEARLADAIDRNLSRLMREHAIPGVQVSLVIADRPIRTHCRGVSHTSPSRPMTALCRWRAASLSKPLAAIVALRLAELGRFDLDGPAPHALRPFFPDAPHAALAAITPRLLLCHRAGLAPSYSPQLPLESPPADNTGALRGALGPGCTLAIARDPGSHTTYCAGGYMLLQHLMEIATGQPFERLLRECCTDPLGLPRTTCDASAHFDPDLVTPHDAHGRPLSPTWSPAAAATGLVTTSHDMAAILQALMRSAGGLPSPLNLNPQSALAILTPFPVGAAFTLGLHLLHDTDERVLTHGGILTGLRSLVTIIPRRRTAFVGVANSDSGFAALRPLSGLVQQVALARP